MLPPRLPFRILACALAAAFLSACAPTSSQGTAPAAAVPGLHGDPQRFRAAFSDAGVAWVVDGQACVARAPGYRVTCPKLPPASDVAWQGETAWALLPGPGLAVTLDLAPRSVVAGAAAALSSTRIYRRDGSTLSYDGEPGRGIAGRPQSAVTGGDGQDYVWLAGQVRRVSDGVVTERQARSFLYPTPAGAATAWLPTAADRFGEYRLTGSALEHFTAGQVVARVPHGAGRVGLVQGEVVTVSPAGELRRFAADLRPLLRLPAAGHSVLAAAPHVRVP